MNNEAFMIGYLTKQAAIKPASPPAYNGAQDPNPEPLDPRQNRFSKVLTAISASKQAEPPGEGGQKQADCGESHIEPRPKLEPLLVPDLGLGDNEESETLQEKAAKVLTTLGRKRIKETNFAVPSKAENTEEKAESGNYPINDISHARNALARSSGKAVEGEVRAKVYSKYPSLKANAEKEATFRRLLQLCKEGKEKPTTKAGKKDKMHTVMSEYKDKTLRSGSKTGPVVKNRKQAIAIALSESGQSKK